VIKIVILKATRIDMASRYEGVNENTAVRLAVRSREAIREFISPNRPTILGMRRKPKIETNRVIA
jgi:hypothetical protein